MATVDSAGEEREDSLEEELLQDDSQNESLEEAVQTYQPECAGADLEERVSAYKPNWLMKKTVGLLKNTHLPDDEDYSQMNPLEKTVTKYLKRPLVGTAGFWVRSFVGGTTGEVMENAAGYLEQELGIEEDCLTYTRDSLIFGSTWGAISVIGLMTGAIVMPAMPFVPAVLAGFFSTVNPFVYFGDMTRRWYLYSQKKPSGTIYFETAWWAKKKIEKHIISPAKQLYSERIAPAMSNFYENTISPALDKVSKFYTEKVEPNLQYLAGVTNPLMPSLPYVPDPLAQSIEEEEEEIVED